jgi:glycosyltransferase involved in cell wall biosynthesis
MAVIIGESGAGMEKISIVVPCYCEEQAIGLFYTEICKVADTMKPVPFELIFVDDGSTDGSLSAIKQLAAEDSRIKYISFSRNFGKESAMYAGLCQAGGGYVAIMDADLQDPPSLLPEMYEEITKNGYDCVATRRVTRKGEPAIRSFFARRFYKTINRISKLEIMDGARDFRLMTRQMVRSIVSLGEYNRFSKGIFSWVGYNVKWLEYENIERAAGETKWSFWKLLIYSVDGIAAFSTVPLSISSVAGMLFFIISIIGIAVTIIRQLVWGYSAYGWSSLVCIILLIAGVQLFCIGILGHYLAKTYMESKHRPIYIVKQTNIAEGESDNG